MYTYKKDDVVVTVSKKKLNISSNAGIVEEIVNDNDQEVKKFKKENQDFLLANLLMNNNFLLSVVKTFKYLKDKGMDIGPDGIDIVTDYEDIIKDK